MTKRGIFGVALAVLVILVMAGSWKRADGSSDAQAAAAAVWAKGIKDNMSYYGIRTFRGLPDSSGGCLAVGDSGSEYFGSLDAWAVHLDKTGKILNQMIYGGKTHERLMSICESLDTGYLVAGRTQFDPIGEQGGFGLLMKLGADLNPIWAKTVSASRTENWIERVLKLNKAQGYLAIMPFKESYYHPRVLVRLNSSGCVVWAFKLGDANLSFDIREVLQAPDGGFFLAGSVHSLSEYDAVIIKIDGNGNFKWAKTFGGGGANSSERIESAYLTNSNGLMVFGASEGTGLALKLDLNGNVKWQYLYRGSLQNLGGLRYGIPGEGGGFYFVGTDSLNDTEINFAKCDPTGRILSKKAYRAFSGSSLYEWMSHAFRSSDGGIFFLNEYVSPTDVVIAKLNTSGNLPQKCPPISWNVTRSKTKYKMINISIPYSSVKVTVKTTKISARKVSFAISEACY